MDSTQTKKHKRNISTGTKLSPTYYHYKGVLQTMKPPEGKVIFKVKNDFPVGA